MKKILIIGAGRSSGAMIDYLIAHAASINAFITVADIQIEHAQAHTANHAHCMATYFNITDMVSSEEHIAAHDIIISMLPPALHDQVAVLCLSHCKHLLTASYVSPAIKRLDNDVQKAGLLFLCEMGLDPGIDHMSAMRAIDHIHGLNATIHSFKSYCGGLVAPLSDDNPWHYKVSWNPRNVVAAGQGTAKYMVDGIYKYIPYNRIFKETEKVVIQGYGEYESYANRDALLYKEAYGLNNIQTIYRGTLRYTGYCKAWQTLIDIGYTDDSYRLMHTKQNKIVDVLESLLPVNRGADVQKALLKFINTSDDNDVLKCLEYLGILDTEHLPFDYPSPAGLLQYLLEKKLALKVADKDLILMKHELRYNVSDQKYIHTYTLTLEGLNNKDTAMARTVGLPLAFMAELLATQPIKASGVLIPTTKEIYQPVLAKLQNAGIVFSEEITVINESEPHRHVLP